MRQRELSVRNIGEGKKEREGRRNALVSPREVVFLPYRLEQDVLYSTVNHKGESCSESSEDGLWWWW